MPSAKDLRWMRSSFAAIFTAIFTAIGSFAGFGCTQMPEVARGIPIDWSASPTNAPVVSVDRATPRDSAGASRAFNARAFKERALREKRGAGVAGATPAAAARVPATNGRDDAGILHVNQMYGRGQRARNGNPMARSARSGHRNRDGAREVAVDRRARESSPLDRSGASVDYESPDQHAVPSRAGVGEMEASETSAPKRTVVHGERSGDDVSEMTRFVRPADPPPRSRLGSPRDAPRDFRTVFSDPAVFSVERPLFSWTRCGHGRF